MSETVFVLMPPNREGLARQRPVVATTPEMAAEKGAKALDLPVSALDLSNWEEASKRTIDKLLFKYIDRNARPEPVRYYIVQCELEEDD